MNEKLKNLNKKQFEKCLITLEMLTFETPKIYTGFDVCIITQQLFDIGKFYICISNA